MGNKPDEKSDFMEAASRTVDAILLKVADMCTVKFGSAYYPIDELKSIAHVLGLGFGTVFFGIAIGFNFRWYIVFPLFAVAIFGYKQWMKQNKSSWRYHYLDTPVFLMYLVAAVTLVTDLAIDIMQPDSITKAVLILIFGFIGDLLGMGFRFFFGGPPVL